MADLDLDRLQALHEAATPGPWFGDWTIVNEHGDPIARTDVSLASDPAEADNDGPLIVAMRNSIPALLAEVRAVRAERDEAVALIDAAMSDVRPESFLEEAQAFLAKCIAPYSCEQMKAVSDALAAYYCKWALMREVACKAKEERDALEDERDNFVKINRLLRDRPDLGDRARSVDALIQENATLRAERDRTEAALGEVCGKLRLAAGGGVPEAVDRSFARKLKNAGLWREPKETP